MRTTARADWFQPAAVFLGVLFTLGISGCGGSGHQLPPAPQASQKQPAKPTAPPPADQSPADKTASQASTQTTAPQQAKLALGRRLFQRHCAGCHGPSGDGQGPAARFLFPKPRNFRRAKFRIVTTENKVPSDEDLLHVISEGMPGSAMVPFRHLSKDQRLALVAYVRHLSREGIAEQIRKLFEEQDEELDPKELAQHVARATTPGKPLQLPAEAAQQDAQAVARGKELYFKQGCHSCHGETGRGDGVKKQFDDDGTPNSPRDYTRGIFKGGRQLRQLYARILLGMPGSPMPASPNLKPQEILDMARFIDSLSPPEATEKVQHRRQHLVAKRVSKPVGDGTDPALWEGVPAVRITLTPLFWRNYPEPDLHLQAVHDGKHLAVRLVWNDATRNDQAVRPQDFEDMVALQWFRGEEEPFLGMGALESGCQVESWLWRASWQVRSRRPQDVETVHPNLVVDYYPFAKRKGSYAIQDQPKEFLTAAAVGNPHAVLKPPGAASAVTAQGVGSITFLPPVAQNVRGQGVWQQGRWSVVLVRPLGQSAQAPVAIHPGQRLSLAVAVWDGEYRDRNGQKLVSIWHELELEK